MKTPYLLLLTLTLITACGEDWDPSFYCKGYDPEVSSSSAYIVNGTPVTEENTLSTLALFSKGQLSCSAVAWSPTIVLTAAHCVGSEELSVARGLDAPKTTVDDVYVHRFYAGKPEFDIAVLHVSEPIEGPFPDGIYDPFAGGIEPDFRYFCTGMVQQGFGHTKDTGERGLYEIPYEIGYAKNLWVLRTGPVVEDTGVCSGDSGSPLYAFMEDHPWQGDRPSVMVAGLALRADEIDTCTGRSAHSYLETYSQWLFEAIHCANGGEDREWSFWLLEPGTGGIRGNTCEELRRPIGESDYD